MNSNRAYFFLLNFFQLLSISSSSTCYTIEYIIICHSFNIIGFWGLCKRCRVLKESEQSRGSETKDPNSYNYF